MRIERVIRGPFALLCDVSRDANDWNYDFLREKEQKTAQTDTNVCSQHQQQ